MAPTNPKRRIPVEIETPFDKCGDSKKKHLQELKDHLGTALKIEHATLPPYMCALYSIKDGTNRPAIERILSVVMEEMLHMVLVANLLNSIGGTPKTDGKDLEGEDFIPKYPGPLPNSDEKFLVSLNPFSVQALNVFLDIERPQPLDAIPQHENYSSIGQFYASIKDEIDWFCAKFGEDKLFTGDPARQVSNEYYYSGGGEVIEVSDHDSAHRAIKVIVDEGEGFSHSIFSGDHEQFGEKPDLAHFYKFNELKVGCAYLPTDSPEGDPTGEKIPIDFSESAVYPANFERSDDDYSPEIQDLLRNFHYSYSRLLDAIHDGFNGQQPRLLEAVQMMHGIRNEMVALMRIPIDDSGSATVGPSFVYVEP